MAIPTAGRSGVGEPSGPATADVAPVERVRQELFARETQVPIPRSELLKGYEFEKDRYVVIDKEDIEKITPKTATEMQIVEFVKLAEIDPIYLETSYYVSPEGAGEKPYALLFEALRESGYVAPAEFAMRGRQHAVILRAGATGIIAHTMYYADEIRKKRRVSHKRRSGDQESAGSGNCADRSDGSSFRAGKIQRHVSRKAPRDHRCEAARQGDIRVSGDAETRGDG